MILTGKELDSERKLTDSQDSSGLTIFGGPYDKVRAMWSDAIDLRDFYRTTLGRTARRAIQTRLRETWPNVTGMTVLGLGYATPYLRPFVEESRRVIGMMPAAQGVMRWPSDGGNLIALADESEIPLPDLSVDRVLLVHALESSEQLRLMLRELWRVMADGGRLLAVVPNRRGIWARLDRTPFGNGRPYTPGQIDRLLRENMFAPVQSQPALFWPPTRSRMLLATAGAWEQIGGRWFRAVGGVLVVEATKQIYAATPVGEPSRRRRAYAPAPGNGG